MPLSRPLMALVTDPSTVLSLLDEVLAEESYDTFCCRSGAQAYERIVAEHPDCGLQILQRLRLTAALRTLPILVCCADGGFLRETGPVLRTHGCELLEQPFIGAAVPRTVRTALARPQ